MLGWIIGVALLGFGPEPPNAAPRRLDLATRVAAQRKVEEVLWAQRIWPAVNPHPKPALSAILSDAELESKVLESLQLSRALQDRGRGLSAADLQRELERIARDSRAPEILQEIFAALDHDPLLIAETVARPLLARRRLAALLRPEGEPFEAWWSKLRQEVRPEIAESDSTGLREPDISAAPCSDDRWSSFGTTPAARAYHAAVWTGTEMLIWGGSGMGEGARYDPVTDSWAALTALGEPRGRSRHSAIWTGTEMIIYSQTSGGRYDPALDRWRPLSTVGIPSYRSAHTATWTGSVMLVWGGRNNDSVALGDGARYNPQLDQWQPMASAGAPSPRVHHTAIWTGTGLLVWGGSDTSGTWLGDGARYDLSSDSWTPIPGAAAAPSSRELHSAVWDGTQMLVWGGTGAAGLLQDGARFNPTTGSWTAMQTSGAPSARRGHAALWTGSEMLIWGGAAQSGWPTVGGSYDPVADQWSAIPAGPDGREWFTAVWSGKELIVWGGTSFNTIDSGGRYDPLSKNWLATRQQSQPHPEAYSQAVWSGSELVVWGGEHGTGGTTNGALYHPVFDSWTPIPTTGAPGPRSLHSSVWTGSEMIVWGGLAPLGSYLNDGGRFMPASQSWGPLNSALAPEARGYASAVWSGSEMIVWGGQNGLLSQTVLRTGGRYDPLTDSWRATQTIGSPSARMNHCAVWDGSRMLVWGGRVNGNAVVNTGSRYDPVADSWSAMTTTLAPSARQNHVAVWSGRDMVVWGGLEGGATGGRYDPQLNRWRSTSTTQAPSTRANASAVWTGSEMLVWGGETSTARLGDGARYDPTLDRWRPISSTNGPLPEARVRHVAVWSGSEMIVWGGTNSNNQQTATGARYCSCAPNATTITYHRDADLDGFGAASPTLTACSTAPFDGWVTNADDCNDADPNAWAAPSEATALRFSSPTVLTWLPPASIGGNPGTVTYDLLRSNSGGDFSAAVCVVAHTLQTTAQDLVVPAANAALFYLSRADNGCAGAGSLGQSSSGIPRSAAACP